MWLFEKHMWCWGTERRRNKPFHFPSWKQTREGGKDVRVKASTSIKVLKATTHVTNGIHLNISRSPPTSSGIFHLQVIIKCGEWILLHWSHSVLTSVIMNDRYKVSRSLTNWQITTSVLDSVMGTPFSSFLEHTFAISVLTLVRIAV